MKLHISGENYLKTILQLQKRRGIVRSIDVAHELHLSKPSVSNAVHLLARRGYIEIGADMQLSLTVAGREIAERIAERHEFFRNLFEDLGIDASVAAEDACHMEHTLSDQSFQVLKDFVNRKTIQS